MTVANEGGLGGVDPHRFIESSEDAKDEAKIADAKDKVNALPELEELSEEEEIHMIADDREIPRPSPQDGEQRTLQATVDRGGMTGSDVAIGGSVMTSAVIAANNQEAEVGSCRGHVDRGDDGSIRITVTDPEGVTREGGIDEDGHQYLRTDLEDVGPSTVRFSEVDDGEMTVSVEPDDGSGPHELTLEVDEEAEDRPKFNKEDLDKAEDDEQSWVQMLEIVNSVMKHMEEWIAQGWEKGKPNI